MATRKLAARAALVTGGSRGIGRAICRNLAREGADVAINYANDGRSRARRKPWWSPKAGNASRSGRTSRNRNKSPRWSRNPSAPSAPIDLLVTSAGMVVPRLSPEVDFATWQRIMRVNLDGTFLPVMAVEGGMLGRNLGRIVCIALIAARRPRPPRIPYGVSKAGVIAFARGCSEAFAPDARINSIAPGLIETEMAGALSPNARAPWSRGRP